MKHKPIRIKIKQYAWQQPQHNLKVIYPKQYTFLAVTMISMGGQVIGDMQEGVKNGEYSSGNIFEWLIHENSTAIAAKIRRKFVS